MNDRPRAYFQMANSSLGTGGQGQVEPATFRFSGGRSYQLSYLALWEADWRIDFAQQWAGEPAHWRPRRDSNPRPPP